MVLSEVPEEEIAFMNIEFPEEWKTGLYEAILQRRDIRAFRPDPIPKAVLGKLGLRRTVISAK